MRFVLYAVPVLSFLLLGAHFLRDGAFILTAACVVMAVLVVAWRHAAARLLIQAALFLGTIEWLWTAFVLVQQRMAEGRPWGRMTIILGVVALMTAASIAAIQVLRGRLEAR